MLVTATGFAQQSPAPSERERTLLIVGAMLARGIGTKMEASRDQNCPFERIATTLRAAAVAFAGLECPVLVVGHELRHLCCLRADPRAIAELKYAGFGVVSVADNHIYDWRRLDRSRGALPLVVNLDGVKRAFLAFVSVKL